MLLPATIPTAILETILTRLAALFLIGAGNDPTAARDAASHMLATYSPETLDELALAANIVGFSFQALEALSQAADPDIPVTRVIRLRGCAVALNRESAKAVAQLAKLQKARHQDSQAQPAETQPEPAAPEPAPKPAPAEPVQPATPALTKAEADRQQDLRIAASIKRAEAIAAAHFNAAIQAAVPAHRPMADAL